jgi:hypothetical protein
MHTGRGFGRFKNLATSTDEEAEEKIIERNFGKNLNTRWRFGFINFRYKKN